ncbi:hypothetical protein J2850_006243 [Azospirillum picis]|uniref:Uncharacterized protein n=1 Tax=Azospirillum picis TaxID=488438 RepID=A0ABU0MV88_9PROT|nr:hypothetical protein [Azospirillum picis]MDQ0537375.1 hypothetical protein [Azospirillum picis]
MRLDDKNGEPNAPEVTGAEAAQQRCVDDHGDSGYPLSVPSALFTTARTVFLYNHAQERP